MKNLFTVLVMLLFSTVLLAFVPPSQKLNYQAVVRNSSNALVSNQVVGMKISILFGSASGTVVYAETQTPTTNANGLINISIGSGVVVSGTYSTIEWGRGTHFLKTEIDPTGGTAYGITSTSELLSVPYALYASYTKTAANAQSLTLPFENSSGYTTTPFSITNTGSSAYTIAGISANGTGIYGETKSPSSAGLFGRGSGADNSSGVIGMTGETVSPGLPGNSGVIGFSDAHIGVAGTALSGTGGYFSSRSGLALNTIGKIKLTGIGEAAGRILTSDAVGNATWQTPGVDVTLPGGINGNIQFNNNSVFGGDNNLIWNNINKRLGIGTTAPEGMMEIKGNSTTSMPQLLLTETQTEFARLTFKNTANVSKMWTIAGQTNYDDKYSMLNFWYDNGTSGKDILTINGNGRIGIGNSMPAYNLVIDGGSGNAEINLITTTTGSSSSDGLRIGMSAGGANAWLWNNENGLLYFGTNNQQRMTILNNGNVGIGDTTPEATLDVEGTVVIGSGGKVFSEIREITGTTSATTGTTTFSYPTGYTKDNIRVLSCEINYNGNAWIGLAGATNPNETSKVFYYLDSTLIWIYHQSTVNFQNRAFRMMVMKVQ